MADVNVTALVDVMLVMLITFMITAPMMQGGVDVELPRAEARPLSPKEGMVVSVNRNGRIFVDQTAVSYSDFRTTFRSLVATPITFWRGYLHERRWGFSTQTLGACRCR